MKWPDLLNLGASPYVKFIIVYLPLESQEYFNFNYSCSKLATHGHLSPNPSRNDAIIGFRRIWDVEWPCESHPSGRLRQNFARILYKARPQR